MTQHSTSDQSLNRSLGAFPLSLGFTNQLDAEQLGKVQKFHAGLSAQGVLFYPFTTLEDFQNLVRVHLSRIAQTWHQNSTTAVDAQPVAPPTAPSSTMPQQDNDDEKGFLDYIEEYEDAFARLGDQMPRLSAGVEQLASKLKCADS